MARSQGSATTSRVAGQKTDRRPLHARLRAVYPSELNWEVECGLQDLIVGRVAGDAMAAIDDASVSPRHFGMRYQAEYRRHVGRDLGSHTGSRLDGVRIGAKSTPLRDGTVVRLGDVCLVYEVALDAFPRGETPQPGDAAKVVEVDAEAVPGRVPAMELLRARLAWIAHDVAPVLLEGEPGTGRAWIARELHRVSGRTGPFVEVDCAAVEPGLFESRLPASRGGTVLLRELEELPPALQRELSSFLMHVTPEIRVIATTGRPLRQAIENDRILRDLHLRLETWHLTIPPLRRRRGDILDWLRRLAGAREGGTVARLPAAAAEAILLAPWPDNLHGLTRLVDELATLGGELVAPHDLPSWARPRNAAPKKPGVPSSAEFEAAFEHLGGNVSALARHFARNRRQIYRWIELYGLDKDSDDQP